MLSTRQKQAVDLLFRVSPEEAAARLGVRAATVRRWLGQPGFQRALRERDRERSDALRRIAVEGALAAALVLADGVRSGQERSTSRTALDILKMSGVLAVRPEEMGEDALAELIAGCRSAASAPECDGGQ